MKASDPLGVRNATKLKEHKDTKYRFNPGADYLLLLRHLLFILSSALLLMLLESILRFALLLFNRELANGVSGANIATAFFNGVRFDARVVVIICSPLVLAILSKSAMSHRRWQYVWLAVAASLMLLLGIAELHFYREFHQRLNGLVFQYFSEDWRTVLKMLWYGFPLPALVLAWVTLTLGIYFTLKRLGKTSVLGVTMPQQGFSAISLMIRLSVVFVCLLVFVAVGRGTLRQGPPLRWGDAFTTESVFANQLGLNGMITLTSALTNKLSNHGDVMWTDALPQDIAVNTTRELLIGARETLVDSDSAAVRRIYRPPGELQLPVRNVVIILMESFAGHFVGALGSGAEITPNFDRLARDGLLFTRFFSNGTHTHQGMFATMACFPNLPGFEYLMQTPEGGHQFSGLPKLLNRRGYNNAYVYNGDFAWDNQRGFFGNQGMTNFIGRNDYINPVVSDPTWGVSDQDMFNRAEKELSTLHEQGKPFYALLQTLSNHMPYTLPDPLPVAEVMGHGSLDEHLTAMRYSDWALGQFFKHIQNQPYLRDTLFVVLGDHGFGAEEQLTELDLYRFHVPLLFIAPDIQEKFGAVNQTVGSQVDAVPTILGRLGDDYQHQCWGRDLASQDAADSGFAVIKPSGNSQMTAIVRGDHILVKQKDMAPELYIYRLGSKPKVRLVKSAMIETELLLRLQSYVQVATLSLLKDSVGDVARKMASPNQEVVKVDSKFLD